MSLGRMFPNLANKILAKILYVTLSNVVGLQFLMRFLPPLLGISLIRPTLSSSPNVPLFISYSYNYLSLILIQSKFLLNNSMGSSLGPIALSLAIINIALLISFRLMGTSRGIEFESESFLRNNGVNIISSLHYVVVNIFRSKYSFVLVSERTKDSFRFSDSIPGLTQTIILIFGFFGF